MSETTDDKPSNKVTRVIEKYGLDGIGTELETRWTGEGQERASLRELTIFFNKRVLEKALLNAGMSAVETEIDTIYTNLTDDDVSTGVKTETQNRLEQNGIDVDNLTRDFVSYQSIRTYLQETRDAEYKGVSDEEKITKDLENIQRLLTRTHSVTEERIDKLQKTDRIPTTDFEVFIDAQVLCQHCGTQYSVVEFFEQNGCSCKE